MQRVHERATRRNLAAKQTSCLRQRANATREVIQIRLEIRTWGNGDAHNTRRANDPRPSIRSLARSHASSLHSPPVPRKASASASGTIERGFACASERGWALSVQYSPPLTGVKPKARYTARGERSYGASCRAAQSRLRLAGEKSAPTNGEYGDQLSARHRVGRLYVTAQRGWLLSRFERTRRGGSHYSYICLIGIGLRNDEVVIGFPFFSPWPQFVSPFRGILLRLPELQKDSSTRREKWHRRLDRWVDMWALWKFEYVSRRW